MFRTVQELSTLIVGFQTRCRAILELPKKDAEYLFRMEKSNFINDLSMLNVELLPPSLHEKYISALRRLETDNVESAFSRYGDSFGGDTFPLTELHDSLRDWTRTFRPRKQRIYLQIIRSRAAHHLLLGAVLFAVPTGFFIWRVTNDLLQAEYGRVQVVYGFVMATVMSALLLVVAGDVRDVLKNLSR